MDMQPTEITPSRSVLLKPTDGQACDGQFSVDSAPSFKDHVTLPEKKLPYAGSCLQFAVVQWTGAHAPAHGVCNYLYNV